ncbi:MAG: sigma-70 family RNA polymerase sigma factor [Evtepia sp.]
MDNDNLGEILRKIPLEPKSAFEALYRLYDKMMFGVAFSVLRNEAAAQDAVQNVMMKLLNLPFDKFPSSGELCWLYRVTRNEALQLLRGEHTSPSLNEAETLFSAYSDIDRVVDDDACRALLKALDEQSRDIIAMKVISGMTHKEIGKTLRLPTGTVQWKYHKSIHKLRLLVSNASLLALSLFGYATRQNIPPSVSPSTFDSRIINPATIPLPDPSPDPLTWLFLVLAVIFCAGTVFFLKNFLKKPTK